MPISTQRRRQAPGESLVSEYRIQRGDTLSGVARRNQISVTELKRHNNLNNDRLVVGQTLQIPSS